MQTTSHPDLREQHWLFAGPYEEKEGALQEDARNVGQTESAFPGRQHRQVLSAGFLPSRGAVSVADPKSAASIAVTLIRKMGPVSETGPI
jgi:hypothetical protein